MPKRTIQLEHLESGALAVNYLENDHIIMRQVYLDSEKAQITIDAWLKPEFY